MRSPPISWRRLDAAARASFRDAAAPGVIVGVRTPQGTWTEAYGIADPATQAPMQVGMHTRIGSVTKTFTGTVIMQLAQQGKLSLDDVIDKYVPGVPNGDRITLRMLADMTSGVASYTRSPKFTDVFFSRPETVFDPDELIAIGLAESPDLRAGRRVRLLEHEHAAARHGHREGHRQAQSTMCSTSRSSSRSD